MPINLRVSGGLPTGVWDELAARQASLALAALVQGRAFDRGVGSDDRTHKAYSVRYSAFRKRRGYQVSPPNLTRTGRMRRSFRVLAVSADGATLGLSGEPEVYGHFVQQARPWMAPSPSDRDALAKAMPTIVRGAIRRHRRAE
ncbi:MAG: hypothetical protein EKK55_16355 [Rhodocyclaceae bacterium]|nr:MAG: hypothetical protein EKK55_16355 [Rhodocyclaceae bacterium]